MTRGGKREGAGRPTDNPKTEWFACRCTAEEKAKLKEFIKKIRGQK